MNFPFTVAQFLGVFTAYNNAVWPLQILLNLIALLGVFLAFSPIKHSSRKICAILAFLWIWAGSVYHLTFFAIINPAATLFGALFILQGMAFLWAAFCDKCIFQGSFGWKQTIGLLFILYALLIYPLLGYLFGHAFPASPTFGAPCPTTIFTFGILLLAVRVPRVLLIIPALWSLLGFTAALSLGINEDIGLLVVGTVSTAIMLVARPRIYSSPAG